MTEERGMARVPFIRGPIKLMATRATATVCLTGSLIGAGGLLGGSPGLVSLGLGITIGPVIWTVAFTRGWEKGVGDAAGHFRRMQLEAFTEGIGDVLADADDMELPDELREIMQDGLRRAKADLAEMEE